MPHNACREHNLFIELSIMLVYQISANRITKNFDKEILTNCRFKALSDLKFFCAIRIYGYLFFSFPHGAK